MAVYKNITDAVTFTKREDGSPVIGVREYYQRRVTRLGREFSVRIPDVGRTGLCPLHDDIGPSFGILMGRDGRERFNCFGCSKRGHVVDLHREFEKRHNRRNLSLDESAKDLLRLFGEDYDVFANMVRGGLEVQAEQISEAEIARRNRIKETKAIIDSYSVNDYNADIARGVVEGRDNSYFNALLFKRMNNVI